MAQPKPRVASSVWELPRNDVAACVAFYRARDGKVTGDEMSVMLRLQDDDEQLIRVLREIETA